MRILFVDHVWRKHSHSADFFKEILKEAGCDVVDFWFDRPYHYKIPKTILDSVDVVVLWEFLYGRFKLGIPGKRCVYVPMYDNESGSRWLWRRIALSGMPVVSFCDRITRLAKECNVQNIVEAKFAFDPARFAGYEGNPRVVAFWDRGQVGFDAIKALFAPEDVDKVIVVQKEEEVKEPRLIARSDLEAYHVELRRGRYLPKDQYLEALKEPGVFIEPRYKEGIGLPFLEHLAMGKCIVSHDEPTMNEYVEDGKTGVLVDMRHPRRISAQEIGQVRANVRVAAEDAYRQWQESGARLAEMFAETANIAVHGSMANLRQFGLFVLSVFEYATGVIWAKWCGF